MSEVALLSVDAAPRNSVPHGCTWIAPRPPEGDSIRVARPWWSCHYCGSMHPAELVYALRNGATVSWADWKYGWPHKLYVENAPNRYAGQMEITSCTYSGGKAAVGPERPAPVRTWGKFYSIHLQDCEIDWHRDEIQKAMGLELEFRGDHVYWAPYGSQR